MTFQVHIKTGPRVNDEFVNSYVTMWTAREGQALGARRQLGTVQPQRRQRQRRTSASARSGCCPYNTGKSASARNPTAYTWYDELIISRSQDRRSVLAPAPAPAPAPARHPHLHRHRHRPGTCTGPGTGTGAGTRTGTAPAPAPRTGAGTGESAVRAALCGTSGGHWRQHGRAIRPSGFSSMNWAYSLFNSYGTGAFVPDYSFAGAFVIAGSGGHQSPGNVDAAIFDFADAQWKRRANANGVVPREADYSVSETTGAPYYELRSATAGQIPTPAHLYQSTVYIPSSLGGGAKGSYLMMGGSASARESHQGSGIHRMDLNTGLWSRVSNDTLTCTYPPRLEAPFSIR